MIQLAELFPPVQKPDATVTTTRSSSAGKPSSSPARTARLPVDALIPHDFVDVSHLLDPGLDRRLGYHRDARYVGLFYEPRGDEVIWNDGASYGFALGGWRYFADEVQRIADHHACDLGVGATAARHMLVIDRRQHTAYLAERGTAQRFLADIASTLS